MRILRSPRHWYDFSDTIDNPREIFDTIDISYGSGHIEFLEEHAASYVRYYLCSDVYSGGTQITFNDVYNLFISMILF